MNLATLDITMTMTSLEIAELTGKRHDNVMVDVKKMISELGLHAPDFSGTYKTTQGNEYQTYLLPKRESLILVSGYSVELRARIIDRWQELEIQAAQTRVDELARLHARNTARLEHAPMTLALKDSRKVQGKDTQHFHYSNEANMINRIVIGTTAKRFKEANELNDSDHLRDHLSTLEVTCIEHLQKVNTSLLTVGLDYDTRKGMLTKVYNEQYKDALIIEAIGLCG